LTVSSGGFNQDGATPPISVSFDINVIGSGLRVPIQRALEMIHKNMNDNGFSLKSSLGNFDISGVGSVTLFFEKSSSYCEAELYKMINELTTKIDTTSKKYTDSAMVVIQTNILNYLKSIPDEVITNPYKDNLKKIILYEAENKIKKVVEELKKEIRNSATGNN